MTARITAATALLIAAFMLIFAYAHSHAAELRTGVGEDVRMASTPGSVHEGVNLR